MAVDPEKFTEKTIKAINAATSVARSKNHIELSPYHLMSVLFDPSLDVGDFGKRLCDKVGVDCKLVVSELSDLVRTVPSQDPPPHELYPNRAFQKLLSAAEKFRSAQRDSHLAIDHLILASIEDSKIINAFSKAGLISPKDKLTQAIKDVRGTRKITSRSAEQTYDALTKYGQDLTKLAEEGKLDPVIGRDDEVRRVIQVLARRTKNNPVLIGEPGVGKTAIVEGLAQRIVLGDVPENLHCRVFSLDMGALIAGASHRGEFEGTSSCIVLGHVERSRVSCRMFVAYSLITCSLFM